MKHQEGYTKMFKSQLRCDWNFIKVSCITLSLHFLKLNFFKNKVKTIKGKNQPLEE